MPLESRNHVLLATEPAWRVFMDEVLAFVQAAPPEAQAASRRRIEELTPRERDLLELIARGLSNGEIAQRLALSEKTVRNHITSIFSKLQVANRSQAIVLAREMAFGRLPRSS